MFSIPCRCGKTKKNFKIEIGEFFINKCCLEAGFDKLGRREGEDSAKQSTESQNSGRDRAVVAEDIDTSDSKEVQEQLSEASKVSNEEAQGKKEDPDFENMTAKALKELCKVRKVRFSKRDTRAKLIERLSE